jgi:hypothetical protein
MTSGREVTRDEVVAICRMAALRLPDGRWKWTYELIAEAVGVDRNTVGEVVRRANAELIRLHDAGRLRFIWPPPDVTI